MLKKVILITGASSGMGKDFAKALINGGATVYACARRVDKMQDLKESGAIVMQMDISKEDNIVSVVSAIKEKHGGVDVLINNAGFGSYGSVEETIMADARYQFEVNLFGLARLTQLLVPYMRERRSGKIINISSMGGKVYTPLGAWYHATKHALEGWSDCLRVELNQFDVAVVIVQPGIISTEFVDVLLDKMIKRSGRGPYSDIANNLSSLMVKEYERGGDSYVGVITNLIIHIINAKKPRIRYSAGKYAKLMMFIRKWFGDKIYDKLLFYMIK